MPQAFKDGARSKSALPYLFKGLQESSGYIFNETLLCPGCTQLKTLAALDASFCHYLTGLRFYLVNALKIFTPHLSILITRQGSIQIIQ